MLIRTLTLTAVTAAMAFGGPAALAEPGPKGQTVDKQVSTAEAEIRAIEEEMRQRLKVESEEVDSSALNKTFSPTFYKAKVTFTTTDGAIVTLSDLLLIRHEGKFVKFNTSLQHGQKLPELASWVNKDFKLNTEADAKTFQKALDALYPTHSIRSGKKAVKKTDKGWLFIRGKFFDDLMGFEVTVDGQGAVKSIQYSMKIKA